MPKTKYSDGQGGRAKKQATASTQRYNPQTGQWSGPKSGVPKSAASLRSAVMEKKGMDTTMTLTAGNVLATTNTNDGAFVLNLIQQGNGSWNRVGRKTLLKSLRVTGVVTGTMTPDPTTGLMAELVMRMVVVWDKQPSGAAIPTYDTIFGITSQDGTESTPNFMNPPRYDNMDRFRVLRDVVCELDAKATSAAGTTRVVNVNKSVDEYVKLPLLESVYSGQSSPMTIADISTGALYIYFRSNLNQAYAQAAVQLNGRIRYTD